MALKEKLMQLVLLKKTLFFILIQVFLYSHFVLAGENVSCLSTPLELNFLQNVFFTAYTEHADKNEELITSSKDDYGIIGLVGVGRQGQRLLKELLELNIKVRAVDKVIDEALYVKYKDNNLLSLEKAEAEELFQDPTVKAVVVATPGITHYEVVKQALSAGKHVLVEKPFTSNASQAKELVSMAKEKNLLLMVGHNRFYLPHYQRLKTIVESGALGKIVSIEASYLNPPKGHDTTHTALEGLGYHMFYMIHGLLGKNHPTKIISATRSADWETVGVKLLYGDVPVTIKLSREYDGTKSRSVSVKGDIFTATFDYSQEPASTALYFTPTHPALVDEPESFDSELLQQLQEHSVLTPEEAKPSLHHEIKAYINVLKTKKTSPSDGASAISLMETIEQIRSKLADSNIYHFNSNVESSVITSLAESIYEHVGKKGGIVTIDGASGVGKSTLVQILMDTYELIYPSERSMLFALDEMRLPWSQCSIIKKYILGEITKQECLSSLEKNGWTDVVPGQPYYKEQLLWYEGAIILWMRNLRELLNFPNKKLRVTFTNYVAYIKQASKRYNIMTRKYFHPGDTVFVEGKFANSDLFADLSDISIRVKASTARIREQFQQDRKQLLNQEELRIHMTYYDLMTWPSWEAYELKTRSLIDIEVDWDKGKVYPVNVLVENLPVSKIHKELDLPLSCLQAI